MEFKTITIDGQPVGDWPGIHREAARYRESIITVQRYSEAQALSEGQRKWFKGILLPALSKDNGDSISHWEHKLKLAVMPEEFIPKSTTIDGYTYTYLPSISDLSCKKMNQFIEGCVDKLHEWKFEWVTLPDSDLKT